jgi:hypothetical protein
MYISLRRRVVLKLDYEKAYDWINIDFLIEVLKLRGFGDRWICWIKRVVIGDQLVCLLMVRKVQLLRLAKG